MHSHVLMHLKHKLIITIGVLASNPDRRCQVSQSATISNKQHEMTLFS